MKRASRPRTPLQGLLRVLWIAPIFALPFATFFGVIGGAKWSDLPAMYAISLIFTLLNLLGTWVIQYFVAPRVIPEDATGQRSVVHNSVLYGGAALLCTFLAALIIRETLIPDFLGSARQVATLGLFTLLFAAVAIGISVAAHYYQQSLGRARAEEELNLARRIQRSFLLSSFPTMPRLEVHALNVSSKQVSGDFYDVVPAGEDSFLIAIADVAGKGVPAALLSSMLQASLRTQAASIPSVATIMRNINALVYRSTAVQQFATFFLARIEERSLRLSFTNAGHNYPIVFRRGGEQLTLERGGTVVGILETADYEEDRVTLMPGDRVVLYTDGVSEAANAAGELFGEERLCRLVQSLPPELSAREVIERILEGLRVYLGDEEPGDDMTLMVLRVLDGSSTKAGVKPS